MQPVINAVQKALEVMTPRQRDRWVNNQKTSFAIYDSVSVATSQNVLDLFTNVASHQNPTETNLTQNRLDNGKMLVVSHVAFNTFVKASANAPVTSIGNILDTLEGILGGSMTLQVSSANKIEDFPLVLMNPEFNPAAEHSSAVGTAAAFKRFGHFVMELYTPLLIDENQQFGLQVKSNGFTPIANGYLRANLCGLGVLPNARTA